MGFNIIGFGLLKSALARIPKGLFIGFIACFFAYYLGVSHGRAPYKLAMAIQDARAEIIIKHTDKIRHMIEQKGKLADEIFETNDCDINDSDAQRLSDIIGR